MKSFLSRVALAAFLLQTTYAAAMSPVPQETFEVAPPQNLYSINGIGDVNLDGYEDFTMVLYNPYPTPTDAAVYSGKDHTIIMSLGSGYFKFDRAGDVNADGRADLIGYRNGSTYTEYEFDVLSGKDGSVINSFPAISCFPFLSEAGDVNQDGFADVLVSSPATNAPNCLSGGGKVEVFSGKDGAKLLSFAGGADE